MSIPVKNLAFEVGSQTNHGLVKEHNEDEIAQLNTINGDIWVVCNGINGDQGGAALAAKLAVKSIGDYFQNKKYSNTLNALNNAILFANHQIFSHVEKNSHLKGMASTIALILIKDAKLYYAYAGNSRIYIFRNQKLQPLTKDHTAVQQLIDKGEITPEEAKAHPKKEEIYNLLGVKKDFKFSTCKNPISLLEDDTVLITTDGLTDQLSLDEIQNILSDDDASIELKAMRLTEMANKAGGKDNLGFHLVRFFNAKEKQVLFKKNGAVKATAKKGLPKFVPYAILAVIIVIVGYFTYDLFFSKAPKSLTNPKDEGEVVLDKTEKQTEEVTEDAESPVISIEEEVSDEEQGQVQEKTKSSVTEETFIDYTIKKGDNFYRLGIRFGVTVQELEQINNIPSTRLQLDQTVKIPVKAIHSVKQGEVLGTIAEKYNCSIEKIKVANKMETDALTPGQKIYIPKTYN